MIETSSLTMKEINLVTIFLILKIFKEKAGRNNHNAPKLIEKYNNLARELYLVEIKYYLRTIFNTQTILLEF